MKTARQHNETQSDAGFTLIELMVSLGLFTIVVMAAVSALYSVNIAARRVEAMRATLDNLNFAVESMSRTIRTGTNIACEGGVSGSNNCSFQSAYQNPGEWLSLQSTLGVSGSVDYRWWTDTGGKGVIQKRINNGPWIALTAPGIDVQRLSFYVQGADHTTGGGTFDDGAQPSVMMLIQGVATAEGNTAPFAVQTLVSVRSIE
ncbi:prepilin-type N-terminal cleavage/methylation domain-containing protein [Candidatus Nomurabacteria bacterium]|nr:prepilin-type N-terminal cleavage/methylation domain-containing protein [Candidatus Nomurabacteria bacterium]